MTKTLVTEEGYEESIEEIVHYIIELIRKSLTTEVPEHILMEEEEGRVEVTEEKKVMKIVKSNIQKIDDFR